ncbi:MAG: family 78 glycoside hydrolase catalytic domain, partial [Pirellulaceae bacterium]|nr:family 78 glycoside hydrolase catalytic domain [Pirellulaceae bacterium]
MKPSHNVRHWGAAAVLVGFWQGVLSGAAAEQTLTATSLRCEYLINPLGIDVEKPRLSWVLQSDVRGQQQTAYRVLVARSQAALAQGRGDLWDSGKVSSTQSAQVAYAGQSLASRTPCYWKVQVWDRNDNASAWSEPAHWSMGLLRPEDWQAQWIAHPRAAQRKPSAPHNGYHSQFSAQAETEKWVAVDLGVLRQIDAVRLYPARPFDWSPDTPGFLFPLRFHVEASEHADFATATTVVDQTAQDVPNPGADAVTYTFPPITARYVRLTATRLRLRDAAHYGLALAELQVLCGEQVVSVGASATSGDSIEAPGWSIAFLLDSRVASERGDMALLPPAMLRREFRIEGDVQAATAYVSARGLYDLYINGRRVGDRVLAPEWTEYDRRIQYQTYDVTPLLRPGVNSLAVTLADGWYAGRIGLAPPPGRFVYGSCAQCLLQLEFATTDGRRECIVSDGTWRTTDAGPIRYVDILDGEVYDARQEIAGWAEPGFDDSSWERVHAAPRGDAKLVWQRNEPMRITTELIPIALTEPVPGSYVFDLGQNMVGWCRLKLCAQRGSRIQLRHAERLNDDGTIYVANLRGAPQVDQYIAGSDQPEMFEPHFTYHGFRYVEVTGLPARPQLGDLTGCVVHSSSPIVGQFTCSNALVNQLMHNIQWVQRGNMHGVPTDCPQRDERLGWMGDIQAFSQTAIFTMDMAGFFSKWVHDIRDCQLPDGRYPNFAPRAWARQLEVGMGVPAWADAGTMVPWRMYQNYGDRRMLEEHFASAVKWVDYVHGQNPNLLWLNSRSDDYSDWLNGDTLILEGYPTGISAVPKEVLATAFFAESARIVARMAAVLGKDAEQAKYRQLAQQIEEAFNRAYVASDGRIQGDTQAGYALALHFDLLPDAQRTKATTHLLEAIAKYRGHPSTGIQTTHRMMLELTRNGQHAEACRLVQLKTVPSWGYTIEMGATTIWERWDGYVAGRGFQDPGMNSFNHWALGSVGEWVWRDIVGINPLDDHPGYEQFVIRPRPGPGFTWAQGQYDSIRGRIVSDWRTDGGRFILKLQVPPGATARVYLPSEDPTATTEGG